MDTPKNIPWLTGFLAGLYPFLKYYNNNFTLINSIRHSVAFILLFLVAPILGMYILKGTLLKFEKLKKFETLLYAIVNYNVFVQFVILSTWGLKKEYVIIGCLISTVLAFLLSNQLKKVLVFQVLMALLVAPKLIPDLYNQYLLKNNWEALPDQITSVKFKEKPNVYLLQPDGYVNRKTLENPLYSSSSNLYEWLETNSFKVYDNFRSNYPASLVSNASMFGMKQHYFGETPFPALEMPRARWVINGNNSVIDIFRNNGYTNYFIVEDEYFQMNFTNNKYDFQNIPQQNISFISSGVGIVKEVYKDLEKVLHTDQHTNPKFFFIEKVMPHHVHFKASVEEERLDYLEKIETASDWVRKTVTLINEKDPEAIIIILADHGGWVGIENFNHFHRTTDALLVNSIFSTLCAVKWNAIDNSNYDQELITTVNVFRVLFSALSENPKYLEHLEENSSYNLGNKGMIRTPVYRLIDEYGNGVYEEIKN